MPVTLRGFVVLSAALHLGVGLGAALSPAEPPAAPIVPDRFAGPGVEVDAIPFAPAPAAAAPAAAAPAAAAQGVAVATAAPAAQPEATEAHPAPVRRRPRVPAQQPRPRASAASGPSQASAAPAAQAPESGNSAEGGEPARAASGAFGSAGLPAGVRHLPNAFTRALAIANRGDRRWRDLAPGRAGQVHVRLSVGEDGQLGELEFQDPSERDALLPVVRHLLDNTLLLLKNGRFSLDARKERAGTARFRVAVEITERSDVNPDGDPGELFGVAWEAPNGKKPGKSGFVLNSGRQVTAWVWVE